MFDDNIVLKSNLGQKILAGHLVSCRFGLNQSYSLVCISQTLDKLIVHETSSSRLFSKDGQPEEDPNKQMSMQEQQPEEDLLLFSSIVGSTASQEPVYFISLKDVIRCVSVKKIDVQGEPNSTIYSKDLLLIGCSSSIMIYDAMNQTNLLNLNTSTSINCVSLDSSQGNQESQEMATICAGSQRIYALKLDSNLDAEMTSERSTSDSINCVIQGNYNDSLELLITGSSEQKIRVYSLDSFDFNIEPSRLTLEESAGVACLLPIYTQELVQNNSRLRPTEPASLGGQLLPSVDAGQETTSGLNDDQQPERMNYFAYGLENGFVGVYRLFLSSSRAADDELSGGADQRLACERLWRHKSKQVPQVMLMFDVNGDGLDELIVGYKSSRLEARSAFTGQLIGSTRCFNRDRLVGLSLLHLHLRQQQVSGENTKPKQESPTLIACSTSGSIVGFRPRVSALRRPLRGFNLAQQRELANNNNNNNGKNSTRRDDEILHMSSYANLADPLELVAGRQEVSSATADEPTETNLHIESLSDNTKPVKCDSRQNVELLQRLSNLLSDSIDLEKKARQVYHAQMHQVGYVGDQQHQHQQQQPLAASSSAVCTVRHSWSFDPRKLKLRLTIVVSSLIECIDLIELEEPARNLLADGHLLISVPVVANYAGQVEAASRAQAVVERRQRRSSSLMSAAAAPTNDLIVVVLLRSSRHEDAKLTLKVYSSTGVKSSRRQAQQVARIYTRTIRVPKFAMFAPINELDQKPDDELMKGQLTSSSSSSGYSKMSFKLEESLSYLQLLDWLGENFLCFQFGSASMRDQQQHSLLHANQQVRPRLSAMMSPPMMRDFNQIGSRADQIQRPLDEDEFDLRLLDVLQTLQNSASQPVDVAECKLTSTTTTTSASRPNSPALVEKKCNRLSILRIAYLKGQLEIESENSDLLVNLVQFLVIDRLHLRLSLEGLRAGTWKANIEPILDELNAISSIRQLKESETRIQSELYESADYTKNLMQQFAIANQLNEFSTSKLLLNELSMTLTGAQNAAQAHYLNNKTRCALSKQIGLLNEKISFLTGHSAGQTV